MTCHRVRPLQMENLSSGHDQVRLAAVQWSNRAFGTSSAFARFYCILSSGDVRPDVQEEARRGLDLEKILPALGGAPAALPFLDKLQGLLIRHRPQLERPSPDLDQELPLHHRSAQAAVELQLGLWRAWRAGGSPATIRLSDSANLSEQEVFGKLAAFLAHCVVRAAPRDLATAAADGLASLIQHPADRQLFLDRHRDRTTWLRAATLGHVAPQVRSSGAKLLAAALGGGSAAQVLKVAGALFAESGLGVEAGAAVAADAAASTSKVRFEVLDGNALALGLVLGLLSDIGPAPVQVLGMLSRLLSAAGEQRDRSLQCALLESIGNALGNPALAAAALSSADHRDLLRSAIDKLAPLVTAEAIADERVGALKALRALGRLGLAARIAAAGAGVASEDPASPAACVSRVLELVYQACSCRKSDVDVQLAASEALGLVLGFLRCSRSQMLLSDLPSLHELDKRLAEEAGAAAGAPSVDGQGDDSRVASVLDELLFKMCVSAEADARRGGCVLLHGVVTLCGRAPSVTSQLPRIQARDPLPSQRQGSARRLFLLFPFSQRRRFSRPCSSMRPTLPRSTLRGA